MTGALAAALARRNWFVFPCQPGGKRPMVDRWEERACADPDRIARYWPAGANIGIACGPSGLVVVDVDKHGTMPADWAALGGITDGADVLAQLCAWAGQPWPSTYWVKTPSTGQHLYFGAPAGLEIRNSAGKIGPMIDVRASGGYVVGAGSVVDGRAYEVLDDQDPQPLPPWIAALASPPRAVEATRAIEDARHVTADARLRGLVSTVLAGQPGDRNGRLHWAACRVAEMITAGQVSQDEAEQALVSAALQAGLRGGEREARRTFASAMRGASQ